MVLKEKFVSRVRWFKNLSLLKVIVIGLLLSYSENSFCQSNIVFYNNFDVANSTHLNGLSFDESSAQKVGFRFHTGTQRVTLEQVLLGLYCDGNQPLPVTFELEIGKPILSTINPINITGFESLYTQSFTKLVPNIAAAAFDMNTSITLQTPLTFSSNETYLVLIRQVTSISNNSIYWTTHTNNDNASVALYSGWSAPKVYNSFIAQNDGSTNWYLYIIQGLPNFQLIGSLPNASVSTTTVSNIQYNAAISATSGGNAVSQSETNITAKGICWATSSNPTLSNSFTNEGTGTADFTSTLTDLLPNTTYYVRAYVTDASGTYYGSETSFSTNRAPVITSGSGLSTASVAISENTTAVTTIQATDSEVPAQNLTYSIHGGADASKFTINSDTGVLTFVTAPDYETPTDSDTNNTYIVEVQVTDNGSIAKSATQTITITVSNVAEIPTVIDASSLNIGITGVALTATVVTNGGGGSITERGFVYAPTSVNANPVIGGTGTSKIVVSGTLGDFTKVISGLSENTSYAFKAFATNTIGSGYTDVVSIMTNELTAGPSINYESQALQQNVLITPITPTNVGTTIPPGTFSKVSAFAGSSGGNVNNANPLLSKMDAPMGMVMDASRNIYFADSYNHRIKKIDGTTGAVTQIAGQATPTPWFTYDNGTTDGTGIGNALFDQPSGITYDGQGVLYIADRGNNKIRKLVIATGAVTTIAGGGTGSQSGYTDDTGTAARFLRPTDVVYRTESGTSYLYVADAGNHCIRKINLTTNAVTTYAGSSTSGTTEGALTAARFNNPSSLAFSSTGVMYIVDRGNQKIRKIESGTVSTFAGSGTNATTNGTGTTAAFADPYGIAIDGGDNLYITQALDGGYPSSNPGFSISSSTNNYIRKITPSGVVTNFIGSGTRGTTANDNGLLATLSSPTHLLFDNNQQYMYVSEWYGDDIRKVEITGYTISPSLPSGLSLESATGTISGKPTVLTNTTAYTVTGYNYYGTSTTNFNITIASLPIISYPNPNSLMVNVPANITPNVSGSTPTQQLANVTTSIKTLTNTSPILQFALSHDSNYFYYAADNTIYKINRTTNDITVLAGGTSGTSDGTGAAAQFQKFKGIAVNKSTGNIYVIEYDESSWIFRCRQITPQGVVTTIANNNLGFPNQRVAIDDLGNIFYINNSQAIGKIPCITNTASPTFGTPIPNWAGNSGYQGNLNGTGSAARFMQISGNVTIDSDNNLYITDLNLIKKISSGAVVTTFAGNTNNSTSIDGIGTNAGFSTLTPNYVYNPIDNALYGSESYKIRKIDLATASVETIYNQNSYNSSGYVMEMLNGDIFGLSFGAPKTLVKTTIFGYSITPDLPSGLSLNASGQIVGTPTEASPLTTYTIKSVNPYHIVTATTQIEVILPTVAPTASAQTLCSGATVSDLVATGTNLKWYTAATGGVALNTTSVLTTNTYYVSQTVSGLESARTAVAVTVSNPSVSGTISGTTTVCSGINSTTLTLSDNTGSIQWQKSNALSGTYSNISGARSSTYTATNLIATTYYRAVVTSGTCAPATTSVATITVTTPSVSGTISGATTVCSGINSTTLTLSNNTGSIQWQSSNALSGTYTDISGATSSTYTATNLIATTYYRAVVTNGTCAPATTSVATITVRTPSVSGTISGETTVCSGFNSTTLTLSNNTGGGIQWQSSDALSGTYSNISGAWYPTYTATNLTATTYYRAVVTNGTCAPATTSIATISVNASVSGTISGATTVCSGFNSTTLTLSDNTGSIQWQSSDALSGTYTDISDATSSTYTATNLTATTYYKAVVTNGTCGPATTSIATISVTTPSVAGTISGATSVPSGTNSTILTLSDYTGSIQWQSSNALTGTYTDISGAAAATYTATNLTATTYYRAVVSNGVCSAVTSLPATITVLTVNPNSTTILDSQCGTTLADINSTITCYPLANATAYKFKVVDSSTNLTRYYSSSTNSFNLKMLSGTLYDTSYSISVAATIGGVLKAYGAACTLTTPRIKIKDSQCGITLSDINTTISTTSTVTGATSYRFEVTNEGNSYTYDSLTNSFNLSMLNVPILYGSSYAIRVSVKLYEVWQPYGDSCVIYTPSSPVKIQEAQCGTTLNGLNSPIFSVAKYGATGYRFEITNGGSVYTYDSVKNYFRLTEVNGPLAKYGESFSIRVSIQLYGVWQPYSASCTINTPASPIKVQDTQCGTTLAGLSSSIIATAGSYADTTGYRFEVTSGTNVYTYDSVKNFFNLTQLNVPAVQYGASYSIRVSIKLYGIWQPYGASCTINTPLAPLTQLQESQCGSTLASGNTTVLFANSVAVAQKYRFEVSLGANVYTYDTASSSVRSFKMTTVPGLTLVAGTTYGIRVAIMANGVWQPYGASCNVTTYGVAPVILKTAVESVAFNVIASPSPFTENFTLRLTTTTEDKVTVMVYDMTGKLLDEREVSPSELSEIQVGNDFSSGVYNVIVSQGENVKTMRIIKR